MTVWVTSDTHWGHKRILEYCPTTRPYSSVEEHDQALIAAWNDRVRPGDTVYHLGDVAFLPQDDLHEILRQLHGRIHIIKGNHDRSHKLQGAPNVVAIDPYLEIWADHSGQRRSVILFHYPIESWNRVHYGSIHLHGHAHGAIQNQPPNRWDVGVDCHPHNAPFELDYWLEQAVDIEPRS